MSETLIYHIYNRGAHKAPIFMERSDYIRMLKVLYIANNIDPFKMDLIPNNVFAFPRRQMLVSILAYCLMPNHIHIALLKTPEHDEKNVAKFMQKLGTAYSSYYNAKYAHSGTIWQGTYKKKTSFDGAYADTLINYIHLNPYKLFAPDKEARFENLNEAVAISRQYEFSSYQDYLGIHRVQCVILDQTLTGLT